MTSVLLLGSLWFFQKANIEDRLLDSNIAYARKLSDTTDRYLFTAQRELAFSAGLIKDFSNVQQLRQEADRLRLQSGFFNSVLVVKPDAVVAAAAGAGRYGLRCQASRTQASISAPFCSRSRMKAARPDYDRTQNGTGHLLRFRSASSA